jgi:hypothetical protein
MPFITIREVVSTRSARAGRASRRKHGRKTSEATAARRPVNSLIDLVKIDIEAHESAAGPVH